MPITWIIRNLPALIAAAALAGAVWWVVDLRADNAALRVAIQQAEADMALQASVIARQAATAEIHRAHITRMQDEAAHWSDVERQLTELEGRDAPLSDLLNDAAGLLWGR